MTINRFSMSYKDVEIEVLNASIHDLKVDALMCPTNKYLKMQEDFAKQIKEIGGEEIEREASSILKDYKNIPYLKDFNGTCPIGTAVITGAGKLNPRIKYIIHSPVINEPGELTKRTRILSAIRGVMQRAYESWWKLGLDEESNLCESIAIPGFKMGSHKLSKEKFARAIIDGLINHFNTWFVNAPLKKVILFDSDEELLEKYMQILKELED
ncbi:MAG: macro domain-containing protein [Candidatus Helarchaeales archaeon]